MLTGYALTLLAFLFFGGEYPAPDLLSRLFVLHVLILPALIAAVIGAHVAIVWRQKHTNFPERDLRPDQIRGARLWPRYTFNSVGFLFVLWGILALLGGLVQINPIWNYGPYDPHIVSQAAQPDWYMGWLEGVLRLFPNWQLSIFGFQIPEVFFPSILFPGMFFTVLALWPWIERRITKDAEPHDLLQYPRDLPWRTALGTAMLTFFILLTVYIEAYGVLFKPDFSIPIIGHLDALGALQDFFALAVLTSFAATKFVVTVGFGQPAGTYQHYFDIFLNPTDLLWAFAKAKDAAEVAALWDAAMKGGDIPGAYWAVLTHPHCGGPLARRVAPARCVAPGSTGYPLPRPCRTASTSSDFVILLRPRRSPLG